MATTVGLIGVGKMGSALLTQLLAQGHRVNAFDIAPAALKAAEQKGAIPVATPRNAARGSKFVHVFTATDEQVESTLKGPDGVFSGASPGTIVLIHSTIFPATTRRVAASAPKGVEVIDAPMTSKPPVLEAGKGTFMVGGSPEEAAIACAHLKPMCKAAVHCGPLGTGNAMKICKNLGNVVERVMVAETARIVEAAGLDVDQFLEIAKSGSIPSVWTNWERVLVVENKHAEPKRASGLVSKDIHHALALAKELGLDLPVLDATAKTAGQWAEMWGLLPKKSETKVPA